MKIRDPTRSVQQQGMTVKQSHAASCSQSLHLLVQDPVELEQRWNHECGE